MKSDRTDVPRHPIRVVSRRTGLTPALLRAWEKRYGVVEPSRSEGGQRLYSDDDVRRLSLLKRAVEEGRSISSVAGLSIDDLVGLVREDDAKRRVPPPPQPLEGSSVSALFEEAVAAVEGMDPIRLERALTRGAMALSVPVILDQVVVPLLVRMGVLWREGQLGPAHEHLASVVVRRFLEWLLNTVSVGPDAPVMVAGTPAGERHELGALLSAVSGAAEGWRAHFLGPDLPAEEIGSAALTLEAELVALSCVDPAHRLGLPREVMAVRSRLPADVHLVVGGATALENRGALEGDGVQVLETLEALRRELRVRRGGG